MYVLVAYGVSPFMYEGEITVSCFLRIQAKADVSKNARLSDVCISTSAAPTFLPAHYFETKDADGKTRTFDLIDGGVAANNPVRTFS